MKRFDYIVVGGGLAGLYTSYKLSQNGTVALVTRASLEDSNSFFAQGGVAAVTEESDTPQNHFEDTIEAGRGLCCEQAVKILTEEAFQRIEELIAMGMHFDTVEGHLALGLEGGHHHKRILHAGGDATGRMLSTFMIEKVHQNSSITLLDNHLVTSLIVEKGTCLGIRTYNEASHQIEYLSARATILATGGAAALYQPTTNPPTALGDGLALALQAGADLRDMEFVQFHPTALYAPSYGSFLISEAVRGEGAYLLNDKGERFMLDRHPLAELAPRDTVAREIFSEMKRSGKKYVTLSLAHLDKEEITRRFPTITRHCADIGFDFTQSIPVAPAAHYTVGGIATDLHGGTKLERLYAVGEVASTGVMGANRLASNSLIECLVFGKRIADFICAQSYNFPPLPTLQESATPEHSAEEERHWATTKGREIMEQLGVLLMQEVGIIRSKDSLNQALSKLILLDWEAKKAENRGFIHAQLIQGRLSVATALVISALTREESRGGHIRSDFPATLPKAEAYHILINNRSIIQEYIHK